MPTNTLLLQSPPSLSLAQSPIAFSAYNTAYASSSFYYTCTLNIWTGSLAQSGSATSYALRKFPNQSGVGLFDVSRFVNSNLNYLAYQYTSSVSNYQCFFNYNYENGTTGSTLSSSIFNALDGYSIFPEAINQPVQQKTQFWPLMTDGPGTQSVAANDLGTLGIWKKDNSGLTVNYLGTYANGSTTATTYAIGAPGTNTNGYINTVPAAPLQPGFPLATASLDSYTIQVSGSSYIKYNIECAYKFTPVRVLWKNRYGQFDWINFWYKNQQDFTTTQRVYQPQLGSWNSSTLAYNAYQTATQRYIVDAVQSITVNTEFLPESYNEIFKQLLVTDEVYWAYNQPQSLVKPLTIKSSNIAFKTGVNDKLIQYTFTFDIGQPFKLII